MIKIVGVFLIIISTTSYGFFLSGKYIQRIKLLTGMKELLLYILNDIRYTGSDIFEVLIDVKEKTEEPLKQFTEGVAADVEKYRSETFAAIWTRNVNAFLRQYPLKEKDIKSFIKAGAELSLKDSHQIILIIEQYISENEDIVKKLKGEEKEKCRLFKTMGLMCGLFIVIILV